MIILICNIIIFIVAFAIGRDFERYHQRNIKNEIEEVINLPSQSEVKYLKVEEGNNCVTVSNCRNPNNYKVIYGKDAQITFTKN